MGISRVMPGEFVDPSESVRQRVRVDVNVGGSRFAIRSVAQVRPQRLDEVGLISERFQALSKTISRRSRPGQLVLDEEVIQSI